MKQNVTYQFIEKQFIEGALEKDSGAYQTNRRIFLEIDSRRQWNLLQSCDPIPIHYSSRKHHQSVGRGR